MALYSVYKSPFIWLYNRTCEDRVQWRHQRYTKEKEVHSTNGLLRIESRGIMAAHSCRYPVPSSLESRLHTLKSPATNAAGESCVCVCVCVCVCACVCVCVRARARVCVCTHTHTHTHTHTPRRVRLSALRLGSAGPASAGRLWVLFSSPGV